MAEEFKVPEFIENRTFDNIMDELMAEIPKDIDMSEGSHPYNLTAPTAQQEEFFTQYIIAEALKLIFPKFCEGYYDFVNYHGESDGIIRKAATKATGELTITGTDGTEIPAGTVFSTASINDVPSVSFVSTADAVIASGSATVPIEAEEEGVTGNVSENTIILQDSPIDGIQTVTNEAATSGGIAEESDASMIQRIVEYEKMQSLSFVGNDSDYKRWAEEVNGTGTATVVPPAEDDDSGLITIILTDSLGKPATTELCQKVYDHIVSPDDRSRRLAAINGAVISVVPPEVVSLSISATIELTTEGTLDAVKAEFLKNIAAYMAEVPADKEIKYTKVGAVLSATNGVYDYSDLKINDGTDNIAVEVNDFPQVLSENVTFTEAS